jgi:hypothetical protein
MHFKTATWLLILFACSSPTNAGLVQSDRHIDAGYTLLSPPAINPRDVPSPAAVASNFSDHFAAALKQSASAKTTFAPDQLFGDFDGAADLDASASPLHAFATLFDPSNDASPAGSNAGDIARGSEVAVSVPLPPMFWPGLVTLAAFSAIARPVVRAGARDTA